MNPTPPLTIGQNLLHKLLGRQYVHFFGPGGLERVLRARYIGGAYYIHRENGQAHLRLMAQGMINPHIAGCEWRPMTKEMQKLYGPKTYGFG